MGTKTLPPGRDHKNLPKLEIIRNLQGNKNENKCIWGKIMYFHISLLISNFIFNFGRISHLYRRRKCV